nr:MAG TPA: cell wall peptidase [Caudoviricetes sp.]
MSGNRITTEALTWLNTPYHHMANLRGVGVDCAMFLVEVFKQLGAVPPDLDPRPYPHDWHMHRGEERYLAWLDKYADRVPADQVQPGDVVTFKFGRCVSHAGIVIDWPLIIHAYRDNDVVILSDVSRSDALMERLEIFFRVRE